MTGMGELPQAEGTEEVVTEAVVTGEVGAGVEAVEEEISITPSHQIMEGSISSPLARVQ